MPSIPIGIEDKRVIDSIKSHHSKALKSSDFTVDGIVTEVIHPPNDSYETLSKPSGNEMVER